VKSDNLESVIIGVSGAAVGLNTEHRTELASKSARESLLVNVCSEGKGRGAGKEQGVRVDGGAHPMLNLPHFRGPTQLLTFNLVS